MRKNIYIKLLISIVSITVLILALEMLLLLFSKKMAERSWKEHVFDDYVETLSLNFSGLERLTFADFLYILVDSAPDRIAGIIMRDSSGNISISLGSSARGDFIPQPYGGGRLLDFYNSSAMAFPKGLSISANTTEDYIEEAIASPKYRIDLESYSFGGINIIIDSLVISQTGLEGEQSVRIPSIIGKNNIAGSIVLTNNGEIYLYMDVIVFDIDVYGPTEFLIRTFSGVFLLFLPLAVLISLVAGYVISKRNAGMIREIRGALNDLANGNYKVTGDKKLKAYEDFAVIVDSIEQLGLDLERHRQSRKEWLKNISHDLNTPLTSMNILLSGAEDGVFPIDNALISSLKNECDVLASRVASVAYYSNIYYSEKTISLEDISISSVIADALSERNNYIVDSEDVIIHADYELVKRALKELFDNADSYGIKGEAVTVSAKSDKDSVLVTVSNKGSLPSPRPQFFEPWARGDESRHEGGSGLGLPIVHQIMEIHHGSVEISERDGSVLVRLKFPL